MFLLHVAIFIFVYKILTISSASRFIATCLHRHTTAVRVRVPLCLVFPCRQVSQVCRVLAICVTPLDSHTPSAEVRVVVTVLRVNLNCEKCARHLRIAFLVIYIARASQSLAVDGLEVETAMMTANQERTYSVPSLLKSAYHACNEIQRNKFNELEVPSVMQSCCEKLFKIVKLNSECGCYDPLGDRRYMFEKVQPFVFHYFIKNICNDARFYGHTDCLRFALEIGVPRTDSMDRYMDYLKCAHKIEYRLGESTCSNAALDGHVNCLMYLHTIKYCRLDKTTCSNAALNGHLECLKFAYTSNCPWDEKTCSNAALNGHLDCLKYAYTKECPWDETTCSNAALNGHLDCLKYAFMNGCPWNETTCSNATLNGHLDCLKFAYIKGCPSDVTTCSTAALNGKLDDLKHAYRYECPWDETTSSNAALNGHLDCLKYAFMNGCPWDETTCSNAALNGHLDCLKFAYMKGCPWDKTTYNNATLNGHLDCLKYAFLNGCTSTLT